MASMNLPGLLTGIDTNLLVRQLMATYSGQFERLQRSKTNWNEKLDALNTLETKLATFRTTVKDLDDAEELRAFNTTSSDKYKVTAEATASAFEGSHTVVINQLANSEQWVHTDGLKYAEDYVKPGGPGTFIYSYNYKETSITTTATTTLQDLVGLINNDANNPGVTASLLHYEDAYHLVLNSNDAGTDYQIRINSSNTHVLEADSAFTIASGANATLSTEITDLSQFSGTPDEDDFVRITGTDHNNNAIAQTDLYVTQYTTVGHLISEINDAFDGRAKAILENGKIVVTDSTCGTSSLSLTLTYNDGGDSSSSLTVPTMDDETTGGSTTADLTGFAGSDFTLSQAAQDSKIKVDGFPSTSATSEEQTITPTVSPTSGTYTLTYGGQTTDAIDYNDPPTGVGSVQEALEALFNVSSGDITVSGGANGLADGALTFTFLSTLGNVGLIAIDPSNLDQSDNSNYTIAETTPGSDGYINRSSNTVDDVVPGVALHLHDTTDVNGEEVTLTRDIASVKEKLGTMVNAYNVAVAHIQEISGYDTELEHAGVLIADTVVAQIRSQLRDPFIVRTSGFLEDIDTFLLPGDIGLELDGDGLLRLDSTVFDEAIAEHYTHALAIIGAAKTGSSDSNVVEFYAASQTYTTAGAYDVQVTVSGGAITVAKIKLSTESESSWRDMTIDGNIITGNSDFDDNGRPVNPENGLVLSVNLTNGEYTPTIRVKQGFAGALKDALDNALKTKYGSVGIHQDYAGDVIEDIDDAIETEQTRLDGIEQRLIEKFARMERDLALLQSQLAAAGMLLG